MISQPTTKENIIVLTPSGINFLETEKSKPTNQKQDSVKKCLKAEVKVLAFILSGSLSIITEKKSTKLLAQSTLAANVLSSLSALSGFIFLSVRLAALDPAFQTCKLNERSPHPYFSLFQPFQQDCSMAKSILAGTMSMILICTVLEFFLAVLSAVVWWKQSYSDFPGGVLFLPQNHKNKSSMSPKAPHDPDYEELLAS
ncbi:membrane-spanning 4-domains subfamily A member 6A isoform X3 [Sus scrofa]|uniref:membrane-spanning 4-domains subfamily A member 6A isoform X3 n=1 Tax=Sus scrofa TaxID=9823 RepID=UPI000A2B3288|nr:membrane-spanning 4-domains subfamily A member 6A isoform X3 [Sus scrofa]